MPQSNPVGFRIDIETGTIDIGGTNLGTTRKFHNVQANPKVSFVVDDLASTDPWHARGVEIRGLAEALVGQPVPQPHLSPETIRIHPERVISWGLDQE